VIRLLLIDQINDRGQWDDLPDPVGPVTSTTPLRNSTICFSSSGRFSTAKSGMLPGITRITIAQLPRCINTFTGKRDDPAKL